MAPGVGSGPEAAAVAAPGGTLGVSSRWPSVLRRPIVSVAAAACECVCVRAHPRGSGDVCRLDRLHPPSVPGEPAGRGGRGGMGAEEEAGSLAALRSRLWTFPTAVILLSFLAFLFLPPRCTRAWGTDPSGGVRVKLTGSEKPARGGW